jgi:integrase
VSPERLSAVLHPACLPSLTRASGGTPSGPADEQVEFEPLAPELDDEARDEVAANLRAAYSDATRATYAAAMRKLVDWVREHHPEVVRRDIEDPLLAIMPLHVVTLVDFITRVDVLYSDAEGRVRRRPASAGTIGGYISAIRSAHRHLELPDPTAHPLFEQAWRGIRRRRGLNHQAKRAARWGLIKQLVDAAGQAAPLGVRPWSDPRLLARDRALVLVGFAGAFRRSELVSFRRGDVQLPLDDVDSVILRLRRSKTSDQPADIEIPRRDDVYCPVRALLAWLDVADLLELPGVSPPPAERPLWFGFQGKRPFPTGLSGSSVSRVIKRLAVQAGLEPDLVAALASHSLRSGAATSAAEANVRIEEIKDLGRWRSLQTVDRYIQRGQRQKEHPIARLE